MSWRTWFGGRPTPPAQEAVSPRPDLEAFLQEVGGCLQQEGTITSFGVSRSSRFELEGRLVAVSTNGSTLWLKADIAWPWFPQLAALAYAPLDSYRRAKLLEDGTNPIVTGDARFDSAFLLLGSEAPPVVDALRPAHREALLDASHLRPEVLGQEVTLGSPPVSHRVHLRCEPDLRADRSAFHSVSIGKENFRPEFLARSVRDAVALVVKLETAP